MIMFIITTKEKASLLTNLFFSLILLLLIALHNCYAEDNTTITPTQYITDPQSLTSRKIFKVGFFNPANSTNRYDGIWYNQVLVPTVVWVANKDNPINDSSSGVLKIADDGNLVVLDELGNVFWTTNVPNITANDTIAQLLDSGNLVLLQVSDARILWQSFDHPLDTLLPNMIIGGNMRTGKARQLTSWKSQSDPSPGSFFGGIELSNTPQVVIWNGSRRIWRSGPWNNTLFIGILQNPVIDSASLYGFYTNTDAQEDSVYLTFSYANTSSLRRYVVDPLGNGVGFIWDEGRKEWNRFISSTDYDCDTYNKCGPFGSCNVVDSPTICNCLTGFEPKSKDEWSKGIWSSGCVRKTKLWCQRNSTSTSSNSSNEGQQDDRFLKLETMKVPDFLNLLAGPTNVNDCEQECLKNCSCLAYSYANGVGCMSWGGNLVDIKKFPTSGVDLYIRLDHSDLDQIKNSKNNSKVTIITTVLVGAFIISVCSYFSWRWIVKQRGKQSKENEISLFHQDNMDTNMLGDNQDIKIFKFEELAMATNNFCGANKLGQGGFGPVYKGKFSDGQEIAVKRLSKSSGQGLEEFKNEVVVILKLQHRNLVRLLGCCTEGEEKMLIYEYMPNKSLDFFLFDPTNQALLDWRKRFQIIEGIGRGILYLHRDSRLRVIHRDLKASNVLLDEDLNPKISDFGMARIFGGNELQANTLRVVGT